MDKKEIRHIRASMTDIRRELSRARKRLKRVRDGISVLRELTTGIRSTNVAMVDRIQVAKKNNGIYKAAIRRFSPSPVINTKATETVRRMNHEMLLMESQMFKEKIEHFNLARPVEPGELFPDYFYKATALIRRKN